MSPLKHVAKEGHEWGQERLRTCRVFSISLRFQTLSFILIKHMHVSSEKCSVYKQTANLWNQNFHPPGCRAQLQKKVKRFSQKAIQDSFVASSHSGMDDNFPIHECSSTLGASTELNCLAAYLSISAFTTACFIRGGVIRNLLMLWILRYAHYVKLAVHCSETLWKVFDIQLNLLLELLDCLKIYCSHSPSNLFQCC